MTIWPEDCRVAVLVTVNLDGERALLGQHPHLADSEKTLSTTRYGLRRGVDAILSVLEQADVASTWFAPGALVRSDPAVVQRVAQHHEIGMRGDDIVPLDVLTAERRREELRRAAAAFSEAGIVPRGFRLPGGEWPQRLVDELVGIGIDWSSSFVADDLPFTLPGTQGRSLLEIPWHYALEDRQAFEWNFSPPLPAGHSRIASYDEVLQNWMWEFDGALAEGGMFVLTLSPHICGTPGRIGLVEELLAHMRAREGVWFATGSALADRWRAAGSDRGPAHPAAVFLEESSWDSY